MERRGTGPSADETKNGGEKLSERKNLRREGRERKRGSEKKSSRGDGGGEQFYDSEEEGGGVFFMISEKRDENVDSYRIKQLEETLRIGRLGQAGQYRDQCVIEIVSLQIKAGKKENLCLSGKARSPPPIRLLGQSSGRKKTSQHPRSAVT